jgi:FLVCR family feline leukemia virus subgroup C receptor-related protein
MLIYQDVCSHVLINVVRFNVVVFSFLQGAEEDAGRIGLTIVLAGVIGSFVGGVMLDKTHWFK